MFLAGAALALIVPVLPDTDDVDIVPWMLNAAIGVPVGVLLWWRGHRAQVVLLHACLLGGAALVSLGMTFGDGATVTVAASCFFVWVALYAFLFFPWQHAWPHLVFDGLLLVGALAFADVDAAGGVVLLVMGTSAVVGTVTGRTRVALEQLASTDSLTGLANRRRLDHALVAETARSERTGMPYSVIVTDLDGFKSVNDQQGHVAGDRILVRSAQAWLACVRPTDLLTRYGGDEFVALLPACSERESTEVARRLAAAVEWSCSVGVATWRPDDDPAAVLRRADDHLLQAKQAGGGQVISATVDE